VTNADGTTSTVTVFQATSPEELNALAAIFLGGAADKTKVVAPESVHAVDIILGFEQPTPTGETPVNTDLVQDTAMSVVADTVRQAIVVVHDE